jgi:hypothetical protein
MKSRGKRTVKRIARIALLMSMPSACSLGGQSGNEGDMPAPPCAREGSALLRAHVIALEKGCVSVQVDEVIKTIDDASLAPDGGLVSSHWPSVGETLHGVLVTAYSYTQAFEVGAEVAVLVEGVPDPLAYLQLMPLVDDRIRIEWAGVRYEASFDELTRANCDAESTARRETAEEIERSSSSTQDETPTSPPTTCPP